MIGMSGRFESIRARTGTDTHVGMTRPTGRLSDSEARIGGMAWQLARDGAGSNNPNRLIGS